MEFPWACDSDGYCTPPARLPISAPLPWRPGTVVLAIPQVHVKVSGRLIAQVHLTCILGLVPFVGDLASASLERISWR